MRPDYQWSATAWGYQWRLPSLNPVIAVGQLREATTRLDEGYT
jgi:hypothetical protein